MCGQRSGQTFALYGSGSWKCENRNSFSLILSAFQLDAILWIYHRFLYGIGALTDLYISVHVRSPRVELFE